jgi:hypothetical protein
VFVFPAVAQGISFNTAFDVAPDGRIVATTDHQIYMDSAEAPFEFKRVAELDQDISTNPDPAFLKVSPNGDRIALGLGLDADTFATEGVVVIPISSLGTSDAPTTIAAADVDIFANLEHFSAAWMDNDHLAITFSVFGVSAPQTDVLDVTTGAVSTAVEDIGDSSDGAGGIEFDANGNLYLGIGFDDASARGGEIRRFEAADVEDAISSGTPLSFDDGLFVAELLSASSIAFDAAGDMFVGGGEVFSSEPDSGYFAMVFAVAIDALVDQGTPIDVDDESQVVRLDPAGTEPDRYTVVYDLAGGQVIASASDLGSVIGFAIPVE